MTKISALPDAGNPQGSEYLAVVQNGQTRRMTVAQITALAASGKLSAADLDNAADPAKGAALVGYVGSTVKAILDGLVAGLFDQLTVGTVDILSGSGSPEAAVSAPIGSLFLRDDGSADAALYMKASGTGNTGWVALVSLSGTQTLTNKTLTSPTISGGTVNNAPVGATTPSTGAFTTLSATGVITPSQTNGIAGTTTNNNVNAGGIGEYVSATNSGGTSLSNGAFANVTSISLTAGDWDVSGVVFFNTSANNQNNILASVSSTSATVGGLGYQNQQTSPNTDIGSGYLTTPVARYSLASTTTIYLVGYSQFPSGTVSATGVIRARRAR